MKNKNIILASVILLELLSLIYVFPKKGIPKVDLIGQELSKICLNTDDLFQAYKRSEFLVEEKGLNSAALNIMFYADCQPKANKEYLVYFEPLPLKLRNLYYCDLGERIKIYIKNGFDFNRFKQIVNNLEELYDNTDECYDIGRGGYRP